MPDPSLQLYDSTGAVVASNDDWRSDQEQVIQNTGLAPTSNKEAALVATLSPGAYTATVNDTHNNSGVALFDLYDLHSPGSQMINLSTRGKVETGNRVMIGGFIILGEQPTSYMIRAIGPSLLDAGIANALLDPVLDIYNGDGVLINSNDDWRSDQQQQIIDSGLAPSNDREPAIIVTLAPGPYTGVIRGAGDSSGVALFEIYKLLP